MGYERQFAVRFSFLLSIPAVLGANILSIGDAVKTGIVGAEVPMYLVGVVTAAVVATWHPAAEIHRGKGALSARLHITAGRWAC